MQDLEPVARVGDRGQQRQPQRGFLAWLDHRRGGGDGDQHHSQRRQQAPGPPGPEVPQVQPAQSVVPSGQQVGDQESAEHEEDVHAEETARQLGGALVEPHDGKYGQRPHPIQARRACARVRRYASSHRIAAVRRLPAVMLTKRYQPGPQKRRGVGD